MASSRLPEAPTSSPSTRSRSRRRDSSSPSVRRRARAAAERRSSALTRRVSTSPSSSCATRAWIDAISPRSFSARSAAVACKASGRSRFLTSASRSRARSTSVATRASFSSARCRRRLNLPSPAASSTSRRRSSGLEPRISSTRPWLMIEPIEPPRPTSASSSTTSVRRTVAPLRRYWPSPPRCSRRAIDTSLYGSSASAPSSLSKTSSTSQKSPAVRPEAPANSTSSGFSALSSLGLMLPAAQRMASEMFDFPEPFGPTTTATPGSRRTSTGSGNDLKPRSLIARRCTRDRSLTET